MREGWLEIHVNESPPQSPAAQDRLRRAGNVLVNRFVRSKIVASQDGTRYPDCAIERPSSPTSLRSAFEFWERPIR